MSIEESCKFPECGKVATKTWAFVPLCDGHHEAIAIETEKYYNGTSGIPEAQQRPLYFRIHKLIPWSKVNLKVGDRK